MLSFIQLLVLVFLHEAPLEPSLVVTADRRIALAYYIIERTAGLSWIPEDAQRELHVMAKHSINVLLQHYSQWSNDLLAVLATPQSRFTSSRRSGSPPGFLLAGVHSVIDLCRGPLYLMKVIWMLSKILLITMAFLCSMITRILPLNS